MTFTNKDFKVVWNRHTQVYYIYYKEKLIRKVDRFIDAKNYLN